MRAAREQHRPHPDAAGTALIVVDASVVVKWFLPELDSAVALSIFDKVDALMAPDHAVGEIGEVLLRAHRRGSMTLADVRRANDAVATRLVLRSPRPLLQQATTIALDAAVSFYDALYVAAAEVWALDFITADARLVQRLAPTPWGSRTRLLG